MNRNVVLRAAGNPALPTIPTTVTFDIEALPGVGGGIWANSYEEVIYYTAFVGPDGAPLSGDDSCTLHFTKEQRPAQFATHFWSIIVDAVPSRIAAASRRR